MQRIPDELEAHAGIAKGNSLPFQRFEIVASDQAASSGACGFICRRTGSGTGTAAISSRV